MARQRKPSLSGGIIAEANAWCRNRAGELSAYITEMGPVAKLPFPEYGAVCRQALAYAVRLGAADLIPELGITTIEGGASMAEALRQVLLLADWLAASAEPDAVEEWLPASAAVERAEQRGHAITLKWLTHDAAKHGVKIRPRELPGRHKVEVEWNSLAGHLLRPARSEEQSDEEAVSSRLREQAERKRRELPLD
jgi:hypothetical protein